MFGEGDGINDSVRGTVRVLVEEPAPLIFCQHLIYTQDPQTVVDIAKLSLIERLFFDTDKSPHCIYEIENR